MPRALVEPPWKWRGGQAPRWADLLAAVENAPPVAAADVVGQLLAKAIDASEVAFPIADFSGDAPIRLSHDDMLPSSSPHREISERVSLDGSARRRALA